MISVAEASARILERVEPLPPETVLVPGAAGRVLAENVTAPITSPPWDNSSMDGYAVRSGDVGSAPVKPGSGDGAGSYARLRVVATIAAGQPARGPLRAGEAMRIMTGAPVPENADAVIRVEDTDGGLDEVSILNLRDRGRNIRKAGEDFHASDTLFESGAELSAAHIGALASAGIQSVEVFRRPRVAIISSGDELVELANFSPALAAERIVSSNSVTLAALIRDAGGEPVDFGIASDTIESLKTKLEQARDCDLILTTAGVSVGDHDHARTAFHATGGELLFWKVRMRPGAPLAFGVVGSTPWLGMSGNPVSAMVTFEIFVRPVIRKMLGMPRLFRRTIPVTVTEPLTLGAPLMHFLRVIVDGSPEVTLFARLAGPQSSSVVTAMARANALLILPGDNHEISAGEVHRALPLGDSLSMSSELSLW